MISNPELKLLFLKTGLVTALVAAVVGLRIDPQWAASFATAGLFGLLNWYLLAVFLLAFTHGEGKKALGTLAVKLSLLMFYCVIVLPLTGLQPAPFLLGFNMFLWIAVLEAVGALIVGQQQTVRGQRPLPPSLKALLTGRPNA
jgi:hypothetical protein